MTLLNRQKECCGYPAKTKAVLYWQRGSQESCRALRSQKSQWKKNVAGWHFPAGEIGIPRLRLPLHPQLSSGGAGPYYTPKLKKRTALVRALKGVFRPARQSSTLMMSGEGKRNALQRATAFLLESRCRGDLRGREQPDNAIRAYQDSRATIF